MQITKTHKIIISVIAVIVLFSIYIVFDRKSKQETDDNIVEIDQTATTTNTLDNTSTSNTGAYTIERVPITEGNVAPTPMPDLGRVSVPASGVVISPEAKAWAMEKIITLQARLKNNPADLLAWIDLGIYQKQAGDYEGAILSWKYASKLSPTDYISLSNLGNLYAYFLKDNAQAEIYYKQAIAKGPMQAYLYIQLAEVYRDVFKDLDKARTLINQGLSKIPNDPSLVQFQTTLK